MAKFENVPPTFIGIAPTENLPYSLAQEAPWAQMKTLNRLRARTGQSKDALVRWGYKTGSTTCQCGEVDHTMEVCLFYCSLLHNPCRSKTLKC